MLANYYHVENVAKTQDRSREPDFFSNCDESLDLKSTRTCASSFNGMFVSAFVLQVCETQRNDLQRLQLNLDSAHETSTEKTSPGILGR